MKLWIVRDGAHYVTLRSPVVPRKGDHLMTDDEVMHVDGVFLDFTKRGKFTMVHVHVESEGVNMP